MSFIKEKENAVLLCSSTASIHSDEACAENIIHKWYSQFLLFLALSFIFYISEFLGATLAEQPLGHQRAESALIYMDTKSCVD